MKTKFTREKRFRRYFKVSALLLGTATIAVLASYGVAQGLNHVQSEPTLDTLSMSGITLLSPSELERIVSEHKLVAYWVGPEAGFRYLLNASITGQISVKYIPVVPSGVAGRTVRTTYREVITFQQKDAFETIQKQDGLGTCTNFINADGNAVHIDSATPTIIYIGMKGLPIQVLLFDPDTTRNLSYACQKSGVLPIGAP